MSNQPPPIQEQLTDDQQALTMPWILFFNQNFTGDLGTSWTPTFTSLTETGTPTITGRYYQISQALCYFNVTITPATDTTATAGTTYINNFPLTASSNGICFAVSGNLGSNSGMVVASNNRIYVPAWTAVTVPLTIIGIVEAN
jgi:hypothetical protein